MGLFHVILHRYVKGKGLIINNYLFSQKNPDLKRLSK